MQVLRSGRGRGIPEESTSTGRENKSSPGLGPPDLSLSYDINKLLNLSYLIFLSIKKELTLSDFSNQIVYLHQPGETRGERKCPDVLPTLGALPLPCGAAGPGSPTLECPFWHPSYCLST